MKDLYSNANDCFELAKQLKVKLGNEISFYGSVYQEVVSGIYSSPYNRLYGEWNYLFERRGVPFCYKFCKDGFLRIEIGSFYPHSCSMGEKLAALSAFYMVLREQYGEPTVFYSVKDASNETLAFHWSFVNKKQDIRAFQDGTFFEDTKIDNLIVIGSSRIQSLNDKTIDGFIKNIGLPYKLFLLVVDNMEDYVKYKGGLKLNFLENGEMNNYPVSTFGVSSKNLALEKKKKIEIKY